MVEWTREVRGHFPNVLTFVYKETKHPPFDYGNVARIQVHVEGMLGCGVALMQKFHHDNRRFTNSMLARDREPFSEDRMYNTKKTCKLARSVHRSCGWKFAHSMCGVTHHFQKATLAALQPSLESLDSIQHADREIPWFRPKRSDVRTATEQKHRYNPPVSSLFRKQSVR